MKNVLLSEKSMLPCWMTSMYQPTFLVLLDLRQYYEKSNLAVFLSFVYLSSTLWGLPRSTILYPGVTQLNVVQKGSLFVKYWAIPLVFTLSLSPPPPNIYQLFLLLREVKSTSLLSISIFYSMQFFIFVIPNQYYVWVLYPSCELDLPVVLTLFH